MLPGGGGGPLDRGLPDRRSLPDLDAEVRPETVARRVAGREVLGAAARLGIAVLIEPVRGKSDERRDGKALAYVHPAASLDRERGLAGIDGRLGGAANCGRAGGVDLVEGNAEPAAQVQPAGLPFPPEHAALPGKVSAAAAVRKGEIARLPHVGDAHLQLVGNPVGKAQKARSAVELRPRQRTVAVQVLRGIGPADHGAGPARPDLQIAARLRQAHRQEEGRGRRPR